MKPHHKLDLDRNLSVAFFPSLGMMAGNPYWEHLAKELGNLGLNFDYQTPAVFDKDWLVANQGNIDILHIHYCQPFYWMLQRKTKLNKVLQFGQNIILARKLGYRVVFTLHNLTPTYWLRPKYADWLGHFLAVQLADSVVVHCKNAKSNLFRKYFRSRKIHIIEHPNYFDVYKNEISKENARNKLGLSREGLFVFTFFGGIRPNKGIEILIEAFLKLKGDNFRLIIAGNPDKPKKYASNLQELSKNDERVIFDLRFIPDDELQIFLNASDVIVLPFSKILTSGSAHLAFSFGRAVIAPKMGCLPELIKPGCGWLFEPENAASLEAKMMEAATSDIDQIGRNAYKSVSQLSFQNFAAETLKVYLSRN